MELIALLGKHAFAPEPELLQVMTSVFEQICRERQLQPGNDGGFREHIAALVIDFAQQGVTDPVALHRAVTDAAL